MALLSQADVENRLGRTLTADEIAAFTIINDAVQKYVERWIGSSVEEGTSTARYYDGGTQYLLVDPCTSITLVQYIDDETDTTYTVDSDDYTLEPINKTCKTMIRNRYGKFVSGHNNMKITATFSINADAEVLGIVKNAMLEALVSEIDNSDEIIKESIEGYSVEKAKSETKDALDKIRYLFPQVM